MSSPTRRTKVVDLRRPSPEERREAPPVRQAPPPVPQRTVNRPPTSRPPRETLTRDSSPLRAKRKRRQRATLFFLLPLIALLIYSVRFISYSTPLAIKTITITGTHDIDPSLVRTYILGYLSDRAKGFVAHNNILSYEPNVLSTSIRSAFPQIAKVDISRPSPLSQELVITIAERHPFAKWCTDSNSCSLMDDKGYIFATINASTTESPSAVPATQYIFKGGITSGVDPVGQGFVSAHLPWVLLVMKVLEQAGNKPLGATVENDQDVSIPLATGMSIKASFGQDALALVQNLRLILNSEELRGKEADLEYIDLRFGNRVYYKLKGKEQTSNDKSATSTPAH